jgi:hypothetical protein
VAILGNNRAARRRWLMGFRHVGPVEAAFYTCTDPAHHL